MALDTQKKKYSKRKMLLCFLCKRNVVWVFSNPKHATFPNKNNFLSFAEFHFETKIEPIVVHKEKNNIKLIL